MYVWMYVSLIKKNPLPNLAFGQLQKESKYIRVFAVIYTEKGSFQLNRVSISLCWSPVSALVAVSVSSQ